MPGKHSPEKLKERRSRAFLRGFLKSPSASIITKQSGTSSSFPSPSVMLATTCCDMVFLNDPWSRCVTPPSGGVGGCDVKTKWSRSHVDQENQTTIDGASDTVESLDTQKQVLNAAFQLIQQQNNTIMMLTARLEALPLWAPHYEVPHTTWSCEPEHSKDVFWNLQDQLHSLAKSLPAAVDAGFEKRKSDIVSNERFLALEDLVRNIAKVVEHEVEASANKVQQELESLSNRCAQTFSTILRKQKQQDEEIEQLFSMVPISDSLTPGKSGSEVISPSLSTDALIKEIGENFQPDVTSRDELLQHPPLPESSTLRCAMKTVEASSNVRNDDGQVREMTTSEFLAAAAFTKKRLPHIPEPMRLPPMLCDITGHDILDTESVDSELPSENASDPSHSFTQIAEEFTCVSTLNRALNLLAFSRTCSSVASFETSTCAADNASAQSFHHSQNVSAP